MADNGRKLLDDYDEDEDDDENKDNDDENNDDDYNYDDDDKESMAWPFDSFDCLLLFNISFKSFMKIPSPNSLKYCNPS